MTYLNPNVTIMLQKDFFIFLKYYKGVEKWKRKPISNNKLSDDDLFLMNTSPKKPSPSDSDMVKFMADLNRYREEKKEIEKVLNE